MITRRGGASSAAGTWPWSGLRTAFGRATRLWAAQDTRSKWLIAACLVLLFTAHLPSLQFDYAAPDQYRAFRYSADERTPVFRWNACVAASAEFFTLTGRPLLWPTECLEHAVVGKVTDFWLLRPLVLSIALLTVLYLGAVIAPMVGGWPLGVMAASLFALSPGYAFMYLQGMTAGMVLISAILAIASFSNLRRLLDGRAAGKPIAAKSAAAVFVLFLAGCLIYPVWTFLVLPLALLEFGFSDGRALGERVRRLSHYIVFYLLASIAYYALAKAIGHAWLTASGHTGPPPDLGYHALSIQMNPSVLAARAFLAAQFYYVMGPLSYVTPPGLPVLVLVLLSLNVGFHYRRAGGASFWLLASVIAFAVGSVVLLGSVSPWLFSSARGITIYWTIPWYLFVSVAAVGLVASVAGKPRMSTGVLEPLAILLLGVAPAAAMQLKVDVLQVVIANYETWSLDQRLDQWIAEKGYVNQRYLLIVLPPFEAPTFVDDDLVGLANRRWNASLLSKVNPDYMAMMINGSLRRRPEVARSVNLVFCGSDQDCARAHLLNGYATDVVVELADGKSPLRVVQRPFVINLSTLTAEPRYPAIELDPGSTPPPPG